mmetsp:Transcript_25200/g.80109  ORF Transcript_25200/g.80109 Transcript_25200/m.80109 type:complete len:102 (-) Transcript_25200:32-337(-)
MTLDSTRLQSDSQGTWFHVSQLVNKSVRFANQSGRFMAEQHDAHSATVQHFRGAFMPSLMRQRRIDICISFEPCVRAVLQLRQTAQRPHEAQGAARKVENT